MCVSTAEAEFSGTVLYAGRRRHVVHGWIEVVGYQNTVVNLAGGPNAMLLHLPAWEVTPEQLVPVGRHGDLLTRMVDAVKPAPAAEEGFVWMEEETGVQVFEHDIYTVLLAGDPRRIPAALELVAPRKRPRLNAELMEFYADFYPGHVFMVCCFDNAEAKRARPLVVWYRPTGPELLTVPALDCHTGEPPDLARTVPTDHWVIFGTDDAPDGWGEPVHYPRGMRRELELLLPPAVVGTRFTGDLPNGDFAIARDDLLAADLTKIERLRPAMS